MGSRIQPDRPGWSGYNTCVGTSLYELDCQCCTVDDPLCDESYLNIPTSLSKSIDNAPWNVDHNTYITEGPEVPDTVRHIWEVTQPTLPTDPEWDTPDEVTPTICCYTGEDPIYDYLTTEYIDVPPIRVRGLSYPSPVSNLKSFAPKTCIKCYDVDVSPGNGTTISYQPAGGGDPVVAPTDAHGGVQPTTVDASAVDDSYFDEGEQCDEVTFIYCPATMEDALKAEDQCGVDYLRFSYAQDAGAGGEDPFYRRIGINVDGIPVGDGSTISHVLGKDSGDCLYWVEVTDCPTA